MAEIQDEMNYEVKDSSDLGEEKPKTEKETVGLWQERVSLAKRSNDDWARREGADRIVQEYNGKFELFFNGLKGQIPVPPVNLIFAYCQADLANTYNRDPYITVNPKAGSVKAAKLWEVILNYYWRHLKNKNEVEVEIIDKDLVGLAWHKVGYNVESEGAEEDLKIIREGLYSSRVDWKDIVWNLGAEKPPYDCLWIAQRIVKPLKYIKNKYKNAKNLKGTRCPEVDKNAYDKAMYKDDISVGVIWEIWDKETRTKFLIAEGLKEKYLEEPTPWPDYQEEFPFLMYWDFYAPGKRRPMSAVLPWEPQVLEFMVIMAAAINHAKRWSRQMLIKKGAISSGDLDKFERGNDGSVIDYTGTGELDKNVKMIDWGNIPIDYYQLMDRLLNIIRDVSGQPEFERGGVTKTSTRTEGELQLIAEGSKGRMNRRIDRFETHLENIANHMLAHLKSNIDFEETIKITGDTPEEVLQILQDHIDQETMTIKYTPQDIVGEYEAEVKAGSTLPLNREMKQMIFKDILKIIVTTIPTGVSPMVKAVITEILDEYDVKSLEEAYKAEQIMIAQKSQLESKQVNADELKAQTQAEKNMAQAQKTAIETEVQKQEMALGPAGRVLAERVKKTPVVAHPNAGGETGEV